MHHHLPPTESERAVIARLDDATQENAALNAPIIVQGAFILVLLAVIAVIKIGGAA